MPHIRLLPLFLTSCSVLLAQQPPAKFADRDPRYRLQPNDVVDIQYRYTPEYNQTASVQPDGFITLQLIGDIKVSGMTLDDLRTAVRDRAAKRLREPEVAVFLKEYEKPHITVGGEVKKPGQFELHGTMTAIEAIALAGGFDSASAKHSQVILFRRVNSEFAETKILNLKDAINKRNLTEDVTLRAGDMLLVPQNNISKIERFVKWTSISTYAPL